MENRFLNGLNKKQLKWLESKINSLPFSEISKQKIKQHTIKIYNSVATIDQAFKYACQEVKSEYCFTIGNDKNNF